MKVSMLWPCLIAAAGCAGAPAQSLAPNAPSANAQKPAALASSAPRRFASPYTYEWFVRAELLRDSGHLAAAIDAYRSALAGADEDADLLARLASALDEQGSHEVARKTVNEALELDPYSESAWLTRAELDERAGRTDDAYEALEHAETAAPSSPQAPLALAALLHRQGNDERADAVTLRYLARTLPGTRGAYAVQLSRAIAGGEAAAIFRATEPYRVSEPANPGLLRSAAARLLEANQPGLAARVLSLVASEREDDVLRLRVLSGVGSFAELETFLALHLPGEPAQRLAAAQAYLLLGRPDQAAASVEIDRGGDPADPEPAEGELGPLQLVAAEVELARGQAATAAGLFADVAALSGAHDAARRGLIEALRAGGLPELAAEIASGAGR
jgi:thioredoxin-like negative regulator of GroEL